MSASDRHLNASEAAHQLGVSPKALRLYEERGLLAPVRTAAGWRAYGPDQMTRAAEIVGLRALGFSLAQVEWVLAGDARGLEPALATHQTRLEAQLRQLTATIEKVRLLRGDIARGKAPTAGDLAHLVKSTVEPIVAFDLPWPWGGERFELQEIRPITYITGPLGSGKTRLAQHLAEALPDAEFLGLERLADGGAAGRGKLAADAALGGSVEQVMAWLGEDGASPSDALAALLAVLEADEPGTVRHGLSGRSFFLLPDEAPEDFQAHEAELVAEFRPRDLAEREAVLALVRALWREIRGDRLEAQVLTGLFAAENIADQAQREAARAAGFRHLATLLRYRARTARERDAAQAALHALRQRRLGAQYSVPSEPGPVPPANDTAVQDEPERPLNRHQRRALAAMARQRAA